jgi:alanine racemase
VELRPVHAIVDLDALAANFHSIQRRLPHGCRSMPVVKADAYGHGAAPCALRLQREGASILAVAVVEEGVELRRGGVTVPILVMGWIGPGQLDELTDQCLTPNVHSVEQLGELVEFAEARGARLAIHLKLDTGMTRLGVLRADLPSALELLAKGERRIWLEGVFQNYASSDEAGAAQTEAQTRVFLEGLRALYAAGHRPTMIHVANSGATLHAPNFPQREDSDLAPTHVRPGLALYAPVPGLPSEGLSDVMSFVSVVDQVKRVPAGTRVGYGGAFVAARESLLAIVPGGYADGIPRSLSGRGVVLVGGTRCPLAGRVSMDLLAVDVTELGRAPARGDEVVFFGRSGGARLGVEEVAAAAGTVAWELLCGVGPRVPRVIVEKGSVLSVQSKFLEGV